jgi:hypothetical protein
MAETSPFVSWTANAHAIDRLGSRLDHPTFDRQLGALRAAKCRTIFAVEASGKDVNELARSADLANRSR